MTVAERFCHWVFTGAPMRAIPNSKGFRSLSLLIATFLAARVYAQNPTGPGLNSDATYQALRNATIGSEAVAVSDLKLKRDAGTFVLHSGVVCFFAPVNGKVTGAVFGGEGKFLLVPPTESEAKSL